MSQNVFRKIGKALIIAFITFLAYSLFEQKKSLGNDYVNVFQDYSKEEHFIPSFENPEPMVPNEITEIEFNLGDRLHCFKKGHKIMIQIQSSWFPVIDMNPQTFVNIYEAADEDFQKAVHTVYHSIKYPSQLKFNILENNEE